MTDAVFSVGARVHMPRDPHQLWNRPDRRPVTVTRQDVPPLVTVRPSGSGASGWGRSPFRNQEKVLGASVYTLSTTALRSADGTAATDRNSSTYAVEPGAYTLKASCPAGSQVFLWAPDLFGAARLGANGEPTDVRGDMPARRAGILPLGAGAGRIAVTLRVERAGTVPHEAVGCLDPGRLASAVAELKHTGATRVTVSGSGVHAELPPRTRGWLCWPRPGSRDGAATGVRPTRTSAWWQCRSAATGPRWTAPSGRRGCGPGRLPGWPRWRPCSPWRSGRRF